MSTTPTQVPSGPQRMTPSEAFVETMVARGVKTMFGIMGSAFMDAMDIFAPAGIRLVPVVHEQGAAHMADGYARVSGRHGVVIGQNGPGVSNCVTAIAAAFWAHSPVVMITPETGTMGQGRAHGPGPGPGPDPLHNPPAQPPYTTLSIVTLSVNDNKYRNVMFRLQRAGPGSQPWSECCACARQFRPRHQGHHAQLQCPQVYSEQ